jgi:hypothetical protein
MGLAATVRCIMHCTRTNCADEYTAAAFILLAAVACATKCYLPVIELGCLCLRLVCCLYHDILPSPHELKTAMQSKSKRLCPITAYVHSTTITFKIPYSAHRTQPHLITSLAASPQVGSSSSSSSGFAGVSTNIRVLSCLKPCSSTSDSPPLFLFTAFNTTTVYVYTITAHRSQPLSC